MFDPETGDYRWLRKEYEKYILEEEDRTYFVVHIPIHQAYLNLQSVPPDRTVNRTVNEVLQTLPVFCDILYKEIKKKPNSSYQELAKNLGKGRTTISETVKILKDNGLISRKVSTKNQQLDNIKLTTKKQKQRQRTTTKKGTWAIQINKEI